MNENDSKNISHDIEKMIDQKIMKARLDRYEEQLIISKNQLSFFFKIGGALLAVVGLIIPILVTLLNTERVNTAIDLMEQRVERLLDIQVRKPNLKAIFNDKEMKENSDMVFKFQTVKNEKTNKIERQFLGEDTYSIEILNIGDGPAKAIRILLFLKSDSLVNWKYPTGEIGWKKWYYSNEPNYPISLSYVIDEKAIVFPLDVTERIPVNISYKNFAYDNLTIERISAILKVFYEEPEPLSISFNIVFKNVGEE